MVLSAALLTLVVSATAVVPDSSGSLEELSSRIRARSLALDVDHVGDVSMGTEPLGFEFMRLAEQSAPPRIAREHEDMSQPQLMRRGEESSAAVLEVSASSALELGQIQDDLKDVPTAGNNSATVQLLQAFRPCVQCSSYERLGEEHDGGYVMCTDPSAFTGVSAAFSFGINGRDGWGSAVSSRLGGLAVFQFDCFDNRRPECTSANGKCDLRFNDVCLADGSDQSAQALAVSNETKVFTSLHKILKTYAPTKSENAPGGDLVVKIDVEGSEWGALTKANLTDLKRIRQLVIEFHTLSDVASHDRYSQALRRILDAGFAVAHLHGNNYSPLDLFGDGAFTLPDVVEVTFVNQLAFPQAQRIDGCSSEQDYMPDKDHRNNLWSMELPLAELPSETDDGGVATSTDQCRYFCAISRLRLWYHVERIPFGIIFVGRASLVGLVLIAALLCLTRGTAKDASNFDKL